MIAQAHTRRTVRRTAQLAGLAVVALLTLAACGGNSRSAGTAPAAADVSIRARDGLQWNAASYTATATDGKVEIFAANDSSLAHNLHVQDKDGKDMITPIDLPGNGSNDTVTVDLAPGTYTIVCKVAGHSGTMHAELVVG